MSEAAVADPAEVTPQAAEADSPPSEQQEADALLTELEAGKGTPAESEADTPGEDTEVDELEQAAIEARAAEIAEQKAQELAKEQETKRKADEEKAARKADEEGQQRTFDGYINAIDKFCQDLGMDAENAQRILATFRDFNGKIAPVAQRQMQRDLIAAAGLEDYEWTDAKTFIEDVAEARKGEFTKGLIPETKAKSEKALALLKHEKRLATDPEYREQRFGRYNGAPDRQAPAAAGGKLYSQMTPEERNGLTPQQRDEAVAREAQYRSRNGN